MGLHSMLLFVALAAPPQFPYSNTEYGIVMTVPAGFLGEGEDLLSGRRAIACFVKPAAGEAPWVRLCLEKTGGVIPGNSRRLKFAWKGVDLDGASFRSEWDRGGSVDVVAVRVPLLKEPLWMVAMAPAGHGEHAQAALVSALTTLQGESALLSSKERAERAGERVGMIASIIIAIGAGMWIMQRRQRKAAAESQP